MNLKDTVVVDLDGTLADGRWRLHLLAVGNGEELDSESGLHHLAHAACNALFILELELRKRNESLSKSA